MTEGSTPRGAFGGAMALRQRVERWYHRIVREFPIIFATTVATAIFTAGAQYIATIRLENAKTISSGVVRTSDEFQNRFLGIVIILQKFTAASLKEKRIDEAARAELSSTVLTMRLLMSPATGRWPAPVVDQVDHFLGDLGDFERTIQDATSLQDLGTLDKLVKQLVIDDVQIAQAMRRQAEINLFGTTGTN